jgi:hypothetical protein
MGSHLLPPPLWSPNLSFRTRENYKSRYYSNWFNYVPIGESGKRPIISNNKVVTSTPGEFVATNDHEASASGSNSKYFLLRWCPPSLTRIQRRKLQRLRFQEKR